MGREEGRPRGEVELKGQEGMSKQREEDKGGGTWSHAARATGGPTGASVYVTGSEKRDLNLAKMSFVFHHGI